MSFMSNEEMMQNLKIDDIQKRLHKLRNSKIGKKILVINAYCSWFFLIFPDINPIWLYFYYTGMSKALVLVLGLIVCSFAATSFEQIKQIVQKDECGIQGM